MHVLKTAVPILLLGALCGGLLTAKPKSTTKKPPPATSRSHTTTKAPAKTVKSKYGSRPSTSSTHAKPAATSSRTVASKSNSRSKSKPVAARRITQQAPTPERYRELQQALADKGYFQGSVDGSWGPDSVDALKRFQKDQNLGDSGKLDSVSIIALGLGPRRNLSARSTTEGRPKDDNRRTEGSERP